MGLLKGLTEVSLASNKLQGAIPGVLGDLRGLQSLDLSGNELTGKIPQEIGMCTNLRTLNLEGNRLSGEIPLTALSQMQQLSTLDLLDNSFALGSLKWDAVKTLKAHLPKGAKILI
jgi:Leucine-rich repeat (LRR) protein